MRFLAALLLLAPCAARAEKLVLVAGGDTPETKLVEPFAVDWTHDGTPYLVEMEKAHRLRRLVDGKVETLAGTEKKGNLGDGGPAAKALLNGPHCLAVMPDGNIVIADTWNNGLRLYDPKAGTIERYAGTGDKGFAGDGGPALKAKFGGVYSVALDPAKTCLVVADLDNRRVRKIDLKTGIVSTVAGNGQKGVPKDGEPAVEQPLSDPRAAAIDAEGNVYVLERGGHALRVVDAAGKIRTVAGTGKAGSGAGKALASAMNGPKHLCIDKDGSVLIADTENHRVVRYSPKDGTLSALAGTGKAGSAGLGGDPLKAQLARPHGVAVHPKTGRVWVADSSNGRIVEVVKD